MIDCKNPKFDESKVKKLLEEIIPAQLYVKREKNIIFEIESVWKKGQMNRIIVDGTEATHLVDRGSTEKNILQILKLTKDHRNNITGRIYFDIGKERGSIVSLYVKYQHRSFDNRSKNVQHN